MIKVKQCCHSHSQTPKFEAVPGDQLLIYLGQGVVKVEIYSVSPPDHLDVILPSGAKLSIVQNEIVAVILEE